MADAPTLATDASCFTCQGEKQLQGMMVYLLAQQWLALNPMADITPAALAAASNCYTCYMSGKGLLGASVYLLNEILAGGGGGGGAIQVYTGAAPPAAPADPTRAALFYPTGGGAVQQWDIGAATWI